MATIRRRGDSWQVQIRRAGRPAMTATFARRTDAAAWAREVEHGQDVAQAPTEADAVTLEAALARYSAEISARKRGHSPRLEGYIARALGKHPIAQKALGSIRGVDIAALIADLEARGVGPRRIRLYLALLSHLFTVAGQSWGMEGLGNPVSKTAKPRLPAGRNRRLETNEQARLLEAATPALRAAIVFALETAAREGEITALRWGDVDLQRRTARFAQTKSGEPRTVPLSPAALAALETLTPATSQDQDRIWPWSDRHALALAWRRLCKRLGIAGLHFHDLRHEATSRLFERGLSIEKVAAVTGHKTWAMLKRYTHPRAEDIARELAQLPPRA